MCSKTKLCLTVLGGSGAALLCCELIRRTALVTRISSEVARHREVGKFSRLPLPSQPPPVQVWAPALW